MTVVEHLAVVEAVETQLVRLGDVASIDRKSVAPENIADGTTYVGLENIASGGEFLRVGPVENGELASQKFIFNADHILYGKLRPYLAKIAMPDFAGICSTDILPIRVGDSLDKRFLAHFLRQNWVVGLVNGLASGANLPRISPKSLESIEIPVFPMAYQRRVAVILDKADHVRRQRRESLAHLNALAQSVFDEMFGDLDRNTMAWPSALLEQLLVVGPQNGMYLPSSDYGSGTPIVRIDSFRNGVVDNLATLKRLRASDSDVSRYGLHAGDVLINRVNSIEHLGKSAVVPPLYEPTVFESNMMRCRFDSARINNTFIRFTLQSQQVKRQILRSAKRAVNQASINQTDVKNFMLPVPPRELQQTFSERVAGVERLKEKHRIQLAELDTLFASLQHRAFSGRL